MASLKDHFHNHIVEPSANFIGRVYRGALVLLGIDLIIATGASLTMQKPFVSSVFHPIITTNQLGDRYVAPLFQDDATPEGTSTTPAAASAKPAGWTTKISGRSEVCEVSGGPHDAMVTVTRHDDGSARVVIKYKDGANATIATIQDGQVKFVTSVPEKTAEEQTKAKNLRDDTYKATKECDRELGDRADAKAAAQAAAEQAQAAQQQALAAQAQAQAQAQASAPPPPDETIDYRGAFGVARQVTKSSCRVDPISHGDNVGSIDVNGKQATFTMIDDKSGPILVKGNHVYRVVPDLDAKQKQKEDKDGTPLTKLVKIKNPAEVSGLLGDYESAEQLCKTAYEQKAGYSKGGKNNYADTGDGYALSSVPTTVEAVMAPEGYYEPSLAPVPILGQGILISGGEYGGGYREPHRHSGGGVSRGGSVVRRGGSSVQASHHR